ncbi:DUF1972 domain-containing protein [Cohaesibacter celericrescens]|uniref:Glycosyl transferase n=1 Tax=Cohaesibacter celericrescens TaxID=2067669 RepID=A0A2N5XKW9_9HYPH|nr:DUF1972 domain-containing protein [Cohaesibacter celericrescens]PLW75142.1 glycosyl transferase [Cohaesibacter celericrescens]
MTHSTKELTVNILGTRGIPEGHSGFETFVLHLAPFLRDKGWKVNVYCQLEPDEDGHLEPDFEDDWNGIRRIHLGSTKTSSAGSIIFDWRTVKHVLNEPGVDLVLGYNTAVFNLVQRLRGRSVLMNMDGVEWKRAKWSLPVKIWFYFNEFIGANFSSVPIADHPEIAKHLHRHGCFRSTIIPYGSYRIDETPAEPLASLGIEPNNFFVSIARIEPENSILDLVKAFCSKPRKVKLVVLGRMIEGRPFTNELRAAANENVIFPGPIFDQKIVSALRKYALGYLHGHQVGGTNPSLVESLGAGSAIVAHDNRFNRWVAGPDQFYFSSIEELSDIYDRLSDDPSIADNAREKAQERHAEAFEWDHVLSQYEEILRKEAMKN